MGKKGKIPGCRGGGFLKRSSQKILGAKLVSPLRIRLFCLLSITESVLDTRPLGCCNINSLGLPSLYAHEHLKISSAPMVWL